MINRYRRQARGAHELGLGPCYALAEERGLSLAPGIQRAEALTGHNTNDARPTGQGTVDGS